MLTFLIAATFAAPADLVIENARIWSGERVGFAEFAAVRDGRFIAVGKRDSRLIGPKTTHIDARGAVVIPGLIDSHIHVLSGGQSLSRLDLRVTKSREEFIKAIGDWSAKLGPGDWVLGRGWSVESWPSQESPRKEWIDGVTVGHPAKLTRMDGHSCLVNSEALKRAHITKEGPKDPPGGAIDRDAQGEPTGILRDNAMGMVDNIRTLMNVKLKIEAIRAAVAHANENGITAVSDIPEINDLPAYSEMAKNPVRSMRFFLYPHADNWQFAASQASKFPKVTDWIEIKGFKAYMDGSLGSHTGYMREPFAYNPPDKPKDFRGIPMPGALDGTYAKDFKFASTSGYQAIVHAIGDEANHLLLDLLEKNYDNLKAGRCRSEHAQHLLPADIPRFGKLGVIASMQPYHKADDGRYAEKHIGAERCHSSYAYKPLLKAGAVLAFGSDWPVVDLNPFLGMETAVTGRILTGQIWEPQNNISIEDALRAYTSSGAYATFAENQIGHISPGFHADFVILNHSPFGSNVDWKSIKPSEVFVEGKSVYRTR